MTDQTARDRLIAYATTTRTVTVDRLDPLLDAVLAEAAVPSAVPAPEDRECTPCKWCRRIGSEHQPDAGDCSGYEPTTAAVPAPAADRAEAVASCPGRELDPNPCRCPCYGCKHHCSAHNPDEVLDDAPIVDPDERRERYARALAEITVGHRAFVKVDVQAENERADAVIAIADAEQADLRRERDLAIAHDRQPYPTAWAYEQACKALRRKTDLLDKVDALGLAWSRPSMSAPTRLAGEHLLRLLASAPDSDEALPAVVPGGAGEEPADEARGLACGCPSEDAIEHGFGTEDCTCIPFTRQTDPPRYCQPGDTVDMITGWERGSDCPHHRTAGGAQQSKEA